MTLRSTLFFLLVQLTLASAAPGAETGAMSFANVALDDTAAPEPVPTRPAAPTGAAASASSAEGDTWWSSAASLVGLAPDAKGETADLAPALPPAPGDYVVGPGDQLGISVWRDEHLTRTVTVLPDGKISFPLVGEVVASGKTVLQLKDELERKLSRYVSSAGVTVEVKQSNTIVYIIGRVNAPGRQVIAAPTNVLQALAMAGGLNPFADRSGVMVFRQQEGKTSVFAFDYDDVSRGRQLETNIELKRGDVVIVP